jgi:hypothetical protein
MYDGIVLSYGTSLTNGTWYDDVMSGELGLQMPLDGSGGYRIIIARHYTSSAITLASMAQPMLWGTKDAGNPYCPGNNPSHQGPRQWDDDNPADGSFDPARECHSYDWGPDHCPGILGAMMAFWSSSQFTRCDANCDGYFDGGDIDPYFLALSDSVEWQSRYPDCDYTTAADANCDGYVDGADIDPFFAGLVAGECACP